MTDNFTLYLMLVAALAIGFLLGRRELRRRRTSERGVGGYLASFQQLVGERHNLDLDAFVEALVGRDDGIETRLALGALVRRRGEVDKAIRIHQGLLARPALTPAERSQTELELARDYMAAGLLDRAENLLLELSQRKGPQRVTAQRALLEIYQREREWRRAVDVGRELVRQDRTVRTPLAHFHCELAQVALEQGDLRLARQELARGADFDPGCARVSLIGAQVELIAKRYRDVRRLLERAVMQDPDCVPLAVAPYRTACGGLDDQPGYVAFLEQCLNLGPYLAVVEELALHLERSGDPATASEFVMEQLLRNPTLGGFVALLEHLDRDGRPLAPEQLALVHRFSQSLLNKQPVYRCRECGFPSHSLMWQCPSCHGWGTCKPIVRIEQG
jgi:lipopolysaccharide biosynthesis regulator YciM